MIVGGIQFVRSVVMDLLWCVWNLLVPTFLTPEFGRLFVSDRA